MFQGEGFRLDSRRGSSAARTQFKLIISFAVSVAACRHFEARRVMVVLLPRMGTRAGTKDYHKVAVNSRMRFLQLCFINEYLYRRAISCCERSQEVTADI